MAALSRDDTSRPGSMLRAFLDNSGSGGLVLMAAAALALAMANSPLSATYFSALHAQIGPISVQHWINDVLMAVFFLLVGLEIKREVLDGQLPSWSPRILPGNAAAGGMAIPALIFVAFNWGDPNAIRGWTIPAATDIAFTLGVLTLLGPRVPVSLKVFLTALAIIDDLGAVAIIALFYTGDLSLPDLALALVVTTLCSVEILRGSWRLRPLLAEARGDRCGGRQSRRFGLPARLWRRAGLPYRSMGAAFRAGTTRRLCASPFSCCGSFSGPTTGASWRSSAAWAELRRAPQPLEGAALLDAGSCRTSPPRGRRGWGAFRRAQAVVVRHARWRGLIDAAPIAAAAGHTVHPRFLPRWSRSLPPVPRPAKGGARRDAWQNR